MKKSHSKEITEKELIAFAVIAANNFWRSDEADRLVFEGGKWMLYGSDFDPINDETHSGFLFKTIKIDYDNRNSEKMVFSKSSIKHVENGPWRNIEERTASMMRGITIFAAMIGMMIDSGDLQVKRKAIH